MVTLEPPYSGLGVGIIAVVIPAKSEKIPQGANVVTLEPQFEAPRVPSRIEPGLSTFRLTQLGGNGLVDLALGINLALSRQTSHPFGCYPVKVPFWVQPQLSSYDLNVPPGISEG